MSRKDEHMDRILRIFDRCPGTTISALALQSGLARNTVKRLLREMKNGHILEGLCLITNEKELTGRESFFLEIFADEAVLEAVKGQAVRDGVFRRISLAGTKEHYLLEGKIQGDAQPLAGKYEAIPGVREVRLLRVERESLLEPAAEEA